MEMNGYARACFPQQFNMNKLRTPIYIFFSLNIVYTILHTHTIYVLCVYIYMCACYSSSVYIS